MFNALVYLLLGLKLVAPTAEERNIDAVEIFYCDFQAADWDVNFDDWPDLWKRQEGPNLPHYVKVAMEDDDSAIAGRCLTVTLNGGGVVVNSPAVAISDKFSYKVEALVRGENVEFSRAKCGLIFVMKNRNIIESSASEWYQNTQGWQKIDIGPVNVEHPDVRLGDYYSRSSMRASKSI